MKPKVYESVADQVTLPSQWQALSSPAISPFFVSPISVATVTIVGISTSLFMSDQTSYEIYLMRDGRIFTPLSSFFTQWTHTSYFLNKHYILCVPSSYAFAFVATIKDAASQYALSMRPIIEDTYSGCTNPIGL